MKKIILIFISVAFGAIVHSQSTVLPTPAQKGTSVITNATVHTGNGKTFENASIVITDGKITAVGNNISIPAGATVVDAKGKQVYPGLILPVSSLGLIEISAVRASNDVSEIGDMNPNVRSIVAYNTDSKVINTLRSNGILMANIVPQGSFLAGSSSVVQLDAWNWEDASVKTDEGMHFYMPSLMARRRGFGGGGGRFGPNQQSQGDPVKEGIDKIE